MSRFDTETPYDLSGHVALITGANHGIGAATSRLLVACGAGVLVTYLRLDDAVDPGIPDLYRKNRASDASDVVDAIRSAGGRVLAHEADLGDESAPARLFDAAEVELGPVDILVNNATGWLANTFKMARRDAMGRDLVAVSAETHDRQFAIDARGTALMIAEFARRHSERGGCWGRIVGLTSGGRSGFPEEVSYGAAKAALENYTMSAAWELADAGVTANVVHLR
jgi:3-oxoacyl-[acyl-carrier protein] reductase